MMAATRISKAERKDWARETFRGASYMIIPSFTPDLSALDEVAVRAAVRLSIDQGYFAVAVSTVGLTEAERMQMLEIVLSEADGMIQVAGMVDRPTLAECIERAQLLENLGCTHFLFQLPTSTRDTEELVNYGKQLIEATDMGVVFYGTNNNDYRHIDASNVPFDVLERLAVLPNAIAMKCTHIMDPVTALTCCERLGDKILLGPVNLEQAPFMAKFSTIQWTGMWAVDAMQSPDKRYVVSYMNLLADGKIEQAKHLYYEFRDLVQLFWNVQATRMYRGVHPWAHLKYYSYCVGGNGGLLREPTTKRGREHFPPIDAAERELIRTTYEACGIPTGHLNDEEAMVGRNAFGRGVRATDLPVNFGWQ
jgi:4-hydroxy-tetrahydrodipicolinate synthase